MNRLNLLNDDVLKMIWKKVYDNVIEEVGCDFNKSNYDLCVYELNSIFDYLDENDYKDFVETMCSDISFTVYMLDFIKDKGEFNCFYNTSEEYMGCLEDRFFCAYNRKKKDMLIKKMNIKKFNNFLIYLQSRFGIFRKFFLCEFKEEDLIKLQYKNM